MKKLVFFSIVFLLGCVLSSNAQYTKGRFLAGASTALSFNECDPSIASLAFSTTKFKSDDGDSDDKIKETQIGFIPRVGYTVIDNLAVGLDIHLSMYNEKETYVSEEGTTEYNYKSSLFAVGPFARYYFPMNKVNPFVELSAAFGGFSSKYEENDAHKTGVTSIKGGAGIAIPIGNMVNFDIMAAYSSSTLKDKEDNEDNAREITGTFGLNFGFVIFLNE